MSAPAATIDGVSAAAYQIPTEQPESDGTLEWDSTTLVVAEVTGGGQTGLGYSYAHQGAVSLIEDKLGNVVKGGDAFEVAAANAQMVQAVRNLGATGLAAMAISAVDIALWDLKSRLLDVALVVALDAVHDATPIYGSGGFTSYDEKQVADQLAGWVDAGIPRVKIKVAREPDDDPKRLAAARSAIGPDVELYVDANGGFGPRAAIEWANRYRDEFDVRWLEEPVSSDDLSGLRLVRERAPGGIDVAAGEYGWNPWYFEAMLTAGAVDCLQADVTRCLGVTGFIAAASLSDAHQIDLSAHCAPQISAQVSTAARRLRHLEYFHDHVRIESMLFDGVLEPEGGVLRPDRSRVGHGLAFRRTDAERFRVA